MNMPLNAHVLVNKTIISDHTKEELYLLTVIMEYMLPY